MNFNLQLETGFNSSDSFFARVYTLNIIKESEEDSIISFYAQNKTITGYLEGDKTILASNIKVIFVSDSINKSIANLALKLDPLFNKESKSFTSQQCANSIKEKLTKILKEKVTVLEI